MLHSTIVSPKYASVWDDNRKGAKLLQRSQVSFKLWMVQMHLPALAFPLRRSARLSAENRRPATLNPVSEAQGSGQGAETSSDTQLIADEHCPFDMELAVRPPPRVAAGLTLDAPLVVTFSTASYGQRNVAGLQDLSGVWAYLSLVTADRKQSLAPPQKDLLLGHIADSIHPLETVNNRQPFAYATFSGVAIMRPGRYCFKVNIIDMSQ